jgi:hypothetical protein
MFGQPWVRDARHPSHADREHNGVKHSHDVFEYRFGIVCSSWYAPAWADGDWSRFGSQAQKGKTYRCDLRLPAIRRSSVASRLRRQQQHCYQETRHTARKVHYRSHGHRLDGRAGAQHTGAAHGAVRMREAGQRAKMWGFVSSGPIPFCASTAYPEFPAGPGGCVEFQALIGAGKEWWSGSCRSCSPCAIAGARPRS